MLSSSPCRSQLGSSRFCLKRVLPIITIPFRVDSSAVKHMKHDAMASKTSRPKDASLARMFFGDDDPPLPDPRFRLITSGEPRNTLSSMREKIGDHFVEQRSKELHERLVQNAEEKHHAEVKKQEFSLLGAPNDRTWPD